MPRRLALTVAALVLTLAACSSGAAEMPTVEQGYGQAPTIVFPDSGPPEELTVEVLHEGDGTEVGADDYVVADYTGQVWGGEVFDSSFERGAPTAFGLDRVIRGWQQGLAGTHEGDRVLISIPPGELGYEGGNEQAGIGADDTLVFVVDVIDAFAPDATGEADAAREAEPPAEVTVEGELGQPASISVVEGAGEPAESSVTVLARGSGEEVPGENATVHINYAATTWDNSTTESTWEYAQPLQVPMGSGTYFDLLAGVPVGSRVAMLVAPTDSEPAMAAVVDILSVVPQS